MKEKHLILKIRNEIIEIIDWDITIEELELFKTNVAFIHSVEVSEIDVTTIDVYKPEISTTTCVGEQGLMYKAPNQYSSWVLKDGLKFSYDIQIRRFSNGIEELTESGLNTLLEKIAKNCVDDVIIFS